MSAEYAWNIFRYLADAFHVISTFILFYRIVSRRSCSGISFQTHILYLVVFLCRYANEEFFAPPTYNVVLKIFYITSTISLLVLMRTKYMKSYDKKHDNFRIIILLLVCAVITAITTRTWFYDEVLWTYSLWVESVAILPQLFLLQRTQRIDVMTSEYIFFLGIYRTFYLVNWVYQAMKLSGTTPYVLWTTGIVQTLLYSDYIYQYIKAIIKGTEFSLPR